MLRDVLISFSPNSVEEAVLLSALAVGLGAVITPHSPVCWFTQSEIVHSLPGSPLGLLIQILNKCSELSGHLGKLHLFIWRVSV